MSKRFGRTAIVLMMSAVCAVAQTGAPKRLAFEVAVIKPVDGQQVQSSQNISPGIKVAGGRLTFLGPPLMLVELAYGVLPVQIDGMDLLMKNDGMFDISAKLPDGATDAQVPLMLQSMLEDRFKAVIHKGSKQASVLALVVDKDGPKFPRKDPAAAQTSTIDIIVNQGGGQISGVKVSRSPGGMKLETERISSLVYALSQLLPSSTGEKTGFVVDKTGLKGTYDIQLEIPSVRNPGPPPATAEDMARMREDAARRQQEVVADALKKLGLREAQKGQIDTILIEHLEKLPTEN